MTPFEENQIATASAMIHELVNSRYPFLEAIYYDEEAEKWKVYYESDEFEEPETEFDTFSDMIDYLDELNDH